MKFSVDQIIDEICILENIETGEIREVNVKDLPTGIHEGAILEYVNEKYVLNEEIEQERKMSFRARLDALKNRK